MRRKDSFREGSRLKVEGEENLIGDEKGSRDQEKRGGRWRYKAESKSKMKRGEKED